MSTNQLHGKSFENCIKGSFGSASDGGRKSNSHWDIEAIFDKKFKLPTSVKTSKNKIIGLSDARRFWTTDEDCRILIGFYKQIKNVKCFYKLCDVHLTKNERKKLLGNISYNEVELFHNKIKSYKLGQHHAARLFAKKYNENNFKGKSIIKLNPKIDSKSQRRLQCSISLDDLISFTKYNKIYNEGEFYNGVSFEFKIQSSKREFNK